ncbi:polysaccharide deacetylase family protein [Ectobacillus ponti]|uniref:Polysaccharide deacetylase n=1 Tax=Ectobacillus ponti TaxID=2961894 RepID=A0AA42BRF1_9BACI|nr:polysaccharide deacetylase family protein [Ectobacillus ponti]MCP8970872.1 polysaccharide deacetylase [Ectobacillus ponti]
MRGLQRSNRKKTKRRLLAVGVIAAIAISAALWSSLQSAKAASGRVNTVFLAGEQPQGELKMSAPERYGGHVRKVVYLTFDDGPSPYQEKILDILEQNSIKATFFMIGTNIPVYEKSVKRLVKAGHYPGLHSMTHNYKKLYTEGQIVAEMQQVQGIVQQVTGMQVHLTRCPYGSMPGLTEALRKQMADAGLREWDWTVDSLDWKLPGNPGAVIQNVVAASTRNREVILLHEKPQSVQALQPIIDELRKKGYEFEVYDEAAHVPINFWHDERL